MRNPSDLHHLHQILPQMPMTMLRSTRERNGNDLQNADEQLAAVQCTNNVQASLWHKSDDFPLSKCTMKPQEAIRMHRQRNIISGSYQDLQVNCHSETIIRDLFNKIKRGELHIRKAPDVTFAGEVGIDAHGLTKEFFYLVMNCQDMVKEDTSYLKVNDAKSNEELETLGNRNDVSLLLYHAGFGNEQLLLVNKSKATQCILHRQVFMSR
ncbi:uncharacterized protein LOC114976945 isoform X2 [Acropora millepora]|uniref:uncharacterized protein LOC114976945 isoform X2 n=1 Tax=Acropora millepora TaxID=45264 RepID=UPI001CF17A1B|nr:uncharacterized protein LOC114976945 isoform X2 [Acropora millepora]